MAPTKKWKGVEYMARISKVETYTWNSRVKDKVRKRVMLTCQNRIVAGGVDGVGPGSCEALERRNNPKGAFRALHMNTGLPLE